MIEYPNTTIVREQIDPENFIFSGFILSILQKEFLLILSQHGYTVKTPC